MTPEVSAVIATRDRPTRLAALIAGLRAQTLPPERFEVVIVDDGSATPAIPAAGGLNLRPILHATPRGTAAARNTGWRAARAPLVAFTDDDCVPTPGWLAALLAAAEQHPGAIVQGRTEPNPAELDRRGVFSRTICVPSLGPQYEACNILYPSALLKALDGFDEAFGLFSAGEDTDLAWRALEAGASTVFAPEALVHHAVHDLGPARTLREAGRLHRTAWLFARHPGARVMLSRGLFWNGWHYLVLRSLLALWLPRRVRRFLLTRHALQLIERARAAGAGPWAVPFLFAYDAIETGAAAWGAIRYRTPLL